MTISRKFSLFTYKLLPSFLVVLGVFNIYLAHRKIVTNKSEVESIHDDFRQQMVELVRDSALALSNETSRVRRILFQYTYRDSNSLFTVSSPSPSNGLIRSSSSLNVPIREIEARYFVCLGKPYLDVGGYYYGLGDDFGCGAILFLSPKVCNTSDGVILVRSPVSQDTNKALVDNKVLSSSNRTLFAGMVDDTYPLPDLQHYSDRSFKIEESLNERGKHDSR